MLYRVELVRCFVYQCRNLPSGDKDGTSDAQVIGYSVLEEEEKRNQQTKTEVSKDNLNPVFYEAIDMLVCYGKSDMHPPFILDIYDIDSGMLATSKDFLGRAVIQLDKGAVVDLREKNDPSKLQELKPKWENVRAGNNKAMPVCG